LSFQEELLFEARRKFTKTPLSTMVCDAFMAIPRHKFLNRFSADYENWLEVRAENLPLIYADTTLLLYQKDQYISTISQPSFVLKMLDLMDLKPGMKAFELGAGSGWNAALMGHLVGKTGKVLSYEIIPEMSREAQQHLTQFDLPQVEIRQGDALQEVWEIDQFDRGIFTAGMWDLPGIFFDIFSEGAKFLFVLKTTKGDLLLAMERKKDYFEVFEKIYCSFVSVTGPTSQHYHNNLDELYHAKGLIRIYPQGVIDLTGHLVAGKDMVFQLQEIK
jgi:protein-L-isoaspartate(D-aspartate) O-methyltransferase